MDDNIQKDEEVLDDEESLEEDSSTSEEEESEDEELEDDSDEEESEEEPKKASENMIPESRFKKAVQKETDKRLKELGVDPSKKSETGDPAPKSGKFSEIELLDFKTDNGLKKVELQPIVEYAEFKGISLEKAYEKPVVQAELSKIRRKYKIERAGLGTGSRSSVAGPVKKKSVLRNRSTKIQDWFKE